MFILLYQSILNFGGGPVGLQYSKQGIWSGENGGADTGMRPYALGGDEIPVSIGHTSTGKRTAFSAPRRRSVKVFTENAGAV